MNNIFSKIIIPTLKRALPANLFNFLKEKFAHPSYWAPSYSQEGEDMIVRTICETKNNGFYVDVGSFHPQRFSNTYFFYVQGWKGINIDPMPGSMKIFKKQRPRDINLEIAIADKKRLLTYYAFNEPALNGFSKELSEQRNNVRHYKIIFERKIKTRTLKDVLDRYMPKDTPIDFMSIDTEGFDFSVLKSNDWSKYRPGIVLVEQLNNSFEQLMSSPLVIFMRHKGYALVAKTYNTLIFKLKPK